MPTITLNKQDVLKQIGKSLSDEKLKYRISLLGTDLEEVTKDEITVEIFPNRPDLLSSEGFSRALASFIGTKKSLRNYSVKASDYIAKIDKKTSKVRPYAVAAVVKDVNLTDEAIESLMQVQEKLHSTHGRNRKKASIGVYDLDKIKFPITYTTKPQSFKFTPLETNKPITLKQILEIHPKGKDHAYLLDNFKEYPIWIDANNQVLSMPPIINSEETRVTGKTKNLFIDVTGTDKNTIEQALNIIVTSLAERNGKIYSVKIENETFPDLKPKKIKINRDYINKILGLKLTDSQIKTLVSKMGMDYKKPNVFYPAYRADILTQIDIAEDIAIAYGYENFKEELPNVSTIAQEDPFEIFKNKVADILVGFGLLETNTYNLTNKKSQSKLMNTEINCVELENALNQDYNVMRAWLTPSLLKVLSENKHRELPQKIFEIGDVFTPEEKSRVCVLIADSKVDYTYVRQILDSLLSELNLEYTIKETEHTSFIPGRVARLSVKDKEVAYLGELHPKVLTNFELETPVAAFELNLSDLYNIIS